MINTVKSNYFTMILKAAFIGSVIGFLCGLTPSIKNIAAHSYFEYNIYQHYLTQYAKDV